MGSRVSITIVTFNSDHFIANCLHSLFSQTVQPVEVVVVDNCSADGTRETLAGFKDRIRVILNKTNLGFAVAQNQAIAATTGDWVLVLNPDTVLNQDYLAELLDATHVDSKIGTVCGRLLALRWDLTPVAPATLDTAGIYFTPAMRHFDRGWREPDDGRYRDMEYVFGASAAAALYRREMINEISQDGEFFDPDFFFYREDADVAWRAQLLGWSCLYAPRATGYHVRSVGPLQRRRVPRLVNMHSVKNRFLMRVKNITPGVYRRFWLALTVRDFLVIGGCLLCEQSSLPAFWHLARCFPRALRRRQWIMARRRVADDSIAHWFCDVPTSRELRKMRVPLEAPGSV